MKRHRENVKRSIVLLLSFIDLVILTAIYAGFWFTRFYPVVRMRRLSINGVVYFAEGLKFYFRGHLLILLIYFVLLWFFLGTYGGLRIGYLKAPDLFFSQIFAIVIVNVLTYFQISLMRNWVVDAVPFLLMTLLELGATLLWILLADGAFSRPDGCFWSTAVTRWRICVANSHRAGTSMRLRRWRISRSGSRRSSGFMTRGSLMRW